MSRQDRGQMAHYAGQAAEGIVERHYIAHGYTLTARRWRGEAGEIDLIFETPGEIIFVEVKTARSHDAAFASLGPRQQARLFRAADEYARQCPAGSLTNLRFDVAAVDAAGQVALCENAFA